MRSVVVLPTYNEAENIIGMLTLVLASELRPDVLVVDDSSPDGTAALVTQCAAGCPGRVRLLVRAGKEGLGAAYRAGFAEAVRLGYDVIVQMDADGSHPVTALQAMAEQLGRGADVVIGSRYVPGGGVSDDWPWYRKALSRGGNLYARTLLSLPVRDLTGGFKMWRSATLAKLDLGRCAAAGYGFQIQTTLAAIDAGARVCEVPILFRERAYGVSKMSNAIVAEAMWAVLGMRRQRYRNAGIGPIAVPQPRPRAEEPAVRAAA